jgi:hypothetical protein
MIIKYQSQEAILIATKTCNDGIEIKLTFPDTEVEKNVCWNLVKYSQNTMQFTVGSQIPIV